MSRNHVINEEQKTIAAAIKADNDSHEEKCFDPKYAYFSKNAIRQKNEINNDFAYLRNPFAHICPNKLLKG